MTKKPWRIGGYFKIVDASFLESRIDRHELDNLATHVPRENVAFFERLKA